MEKVNITFNLLKPPAPNFPLPLLWRSTCSVTSSIKKTIVVSGLAAAWVWHHVKQHFTGLRSKQTVVRMGILCSPVNLTASCTDCLGTRGQGRKLHRVAGPVKLSTFPCNQGVSQHHTKLTKVAMIRNYTEQVKTSASVAKMGSLLCSIPLPGHVLPSLLQHHSL